MSRGENNRRLERESYLGYYFRFPAFSFSTAYRSEIAPRCKTRLGVSRRPIERTLRLLDESGPAYFHVAQMAHVTPEEYRAIAPHVGPDGVRFDGAVLPLLPESSEQISVHRHPVRRPRAAVVGHDRLRRASGPSPEADLRRCTPS